MHRHPGIEMRTDTVVELDVVTGDGHELTCSATANPELFDGVRGGTGPMRHHHARHVAPAPRSRARSPVSVVLSRSGYIDGGSATRVE